MSSTDDRIARFIEAQTNAGRSSPTGMHWQQFYESLLSRVAAGARKPSAPLILAASGESAASKSARLASQLKWAAENGCLEDAIRFLEGISHENWESCPAANWNRDSYWMA